MFATLFCENLQLEIEVVFTCFLKNKHDVVARVNLKTAILRDLNILFASTQIQCFILKIGKNKLHKK